MAKQKLEQEFITSGATQAAKEIGKVAESQEQVGKSAGGAAPAVEELSDATDGLTVSEDALKNVLGRISPELAGLADGLFNAAKVAGALGTKSLKLTDIMGGAKTAMLKYKDSLLLLGAGGAAFLAIQLLIREWKKLKQEMEDTIKVAERFQSTERAQEKVREQARSGVIEAFAQSNPTASGDEVNNAAREAVKLVEKFGIDMQRAVKIATNLEAPLSQSESDFRRRTTAQGVRRGEAREQITTLDPFRQFGDGGTQTVDRGNQAALLKAIKDAFGEEGPIAQERIRAAQRILANQDQVDFKQISDLERQAITSNTADSFFAGQELLDRLGVATDALSKSAESLNKAAVATEKASRASATTMTNIERKVPRTAVPARVDVGIS